MNSRVSREKWKFLVRILGAVKHLRACDGAADDGNINSFGASGQQKLGASASTGLCGHDVVDQQEVSASRDRQAPWLIEGTAQSLSSTASNRGASPVPDRPSLQGLFEDGPDPLEFLAEDLGEKMCCVESPPRRSEASAGDGDHPIDGSEFFRNLPGQTSGQGLARGSIAANFPPKNSGLAGCSRGIEAKCFGTPKRWWLSLACRAAGPRTRMGTMIAGLLARSQSISAGGAERRPPRHVKRPSAERARARVEKACENVYI